MLFSYRHGRMRSYSVYGLVPLCLLVASFLPLVISQRAYTSPPVRHYDFVNHKKVRALPSDSDALELHFQAFNQTFFFQLEKNHDLVLPEAFVTVNDVPMSVTDVLDVHAYKGKVYQINGQQEAEQVGWCRILFHEDPFSSDSETLRYEGTFMHSKRGGMHHISTVRNYRLSKRDGIDTELASPMSRNPIHRRAEMIIFRDHYRSILSYDDISSAFSITSVTRSKLYPRTLSDQHGCGVAPNKANTEAVDRYVSSLGISTSHHHNPFEKRDSSCFQSSKKVLPMAAAADCAYVAAVGTPKEVLQKILNNWNSASQVYEKTFNIALGLIEVKIMQSCGDSNGESLPWNRICTDSYTVNSRLSDFSQWRGKKSPDKAGLWHLMTKCNTGPSVGVAWLSMLCAKDAFQQSQDGETQWVSGTGLSSIVPTEWKVVAHEVGHNFGAIHDCTSANCPVSCTSSASCSCCPCGSGCDCKGQFLMHPTDNSAKDEFSSCSIQSMCGNIPKLGTCLTDPANLKSISAGICGNGVVEGNEDCDCGSECKNNNCCDGATCKFKNGAQCDDYSDLCCGGCQLKTQGTVCRQANDICAFTSKCDGKSATCPATIIADDGKSCTNPNSTAGGTTCASGICTSRQVFCSRNDSSRSDLQCSSLSSLGAYQTVKQCDGQDFQCALYCQTSNGICLALNGYFLDGTPCGYGGFCREGVCSANGFVSTIVNFFRTQPQIAIPITIVLGLLVLTCIGFCIQSCCCSKRARKRRAAARAYPNGLAATRPTPRATSPVTGNRAGSPTAGESGLATSHWVDPSLYNGPAYSEQNFRMIDSSQVNGHPR